MDKRIWKLIDTCICITESLCCTPETNNIVNQLCSKKKKDVWKPAAWREQTESLFLDGGRSKGRISQEEHLVCAGKERVIMESPGISANQGKRPGLPLPRKVKKEPAEELGSGICTSNLCSYHPMVTTHLILCVQLALALPSCSWELTGWDSDKTRGPHLQHVGRRGINWTFRL